ncbi:hypothetical protein QVD17_05478 [Tagetes erecta]|uniref:Uncharacterized protein n=1 Tax=Tagetes erecta TaxID=13708 RepID=A0AAD8LHJ3_TARER|nr:hypothetical protein QVD17_05478 [Tagetes erecta]
MLLMILCIGLLPFGFASLNTTCLSANEGDALNVIAQKLGKDWDFQSLSCCDWNGSSNDTYENVISCDCKINNDTTCHVVTISRFVNLKLMDVFSGERIYWPILHHVPIKFQTCMIEGHEVRRCSTVSSTSMHIGQLGDGRFTPRICKTRQVAMVYEGFIGS